MQHLIPTHPEIHNIAGDVPTLLFSLAEYQNKEINNMGKRVYTQLSLEFNPVNFDLLTFKQLKIGSSYKRRKIVRIFANCFTFLMNMHAARSKHNIQSASQNQFSILQTAKTTQNYRHVPKQTYK